MEELQQQKKAERDAWGISEVPEVSAEPRQINRVVESVEEEVRTPEILASRYRFLKFLGKGAQSQVYLAERLDTGERVAIKSMRVDSVTCWKEYDLFRRESEVLESLNIDGVAKVFETVEDLESENPSAFIVQTFIDGVSLQTLLNRGFLFKMTTACSIILQLLEILKQLHGHNPVVIHRDIKPSNVLLQFKDGKVGEGDPKVWLIDFGAVANPMVQSGGSTVAGTYGYMPLEQLMGQPCPKSDIYALGVMSVYLLSGVPPEQLEIQDFRLIIEPHLGHLPKVVVGVLRRMLEPKIENRVSNLDELVQMFRDFRDGNFEDSGLDSSISVNATDIDKVSRIGQHGNIEIWQALSEKLPREVPSAYTKLLLKDCFSNLPPGYSTLVKPRKDSFWTSIFQLVLPCFVFGVIGCLILIRLNASLWFLWVLLGVLAMAGGLMFLMSRRLKKYWRCKDVLCNSIKTMAIIESVNYISRAETMPESETAPCYPLYEVIYCFNIEENGENTKITRRFYMNKPNPGLTPGQFIPILYYAKENCVFSLPYPFPLDSSYYHYLGETGLL